MALFLKVLMTVPSFLLSRGLLRLSATFCFNLERTFRLGSDAAGGRETPRHTEKERERHRDTQREREREKIGRAHV